MKTKKVATATKTKRPAYSYLRFSTLEQEKGDSLRRQSEQPETICAKKGWALQDRTFRDCGVKSFHNQNLKKGKLGVFLAALKAGELEDNPVLILEDLDRLSRAKIKASMDVASDILEAGCDIYSVIEDRLYTHDSLNDPLALMGLVFRFHLAHEESEKKSFRARANWQDKHDLAAGGKAVVTRICPAWLKVVGGDYHKGELIGGRFELVAERVAVVKKLFQWCIAGQGTQVIVRRLIAEKVPAFRSGWAQKTIWQIWTDRRVLGDLPTQVYGEKKTKGETITGYYPPIIDQETFDRAHDAMLSRKRTSGRRGDFVNLFTGLVHYPAHNCTMVMFSKPSRRRNKTFQYRYLASYLGWKGVKPRVAMRYDRFEHVVLTWLYDMAGDLMPREPEPDGLPALRAKLKRLETSIAAVADQLEGDIARIPAIAKKVAEMNAKKNEIADELAQKQRQQTRPPLDETKALIDLLKNTTGPALKDLRTQIRQRLLLHIERIDVNVKDKRAYITIKMSSSLVRRIWFALQGEEQGIWTPNGIIPANDMNHMEAQSHDKALKSRGRLARAVVSHIDPKAKIVAYRADAGE